MRRTSSRNSRPTTNSGRAGFSRAEQEQTALDDVALIDVPQQQLDDELEGEATDNAPQLEADDAASNSGEAIEVLDADHPAMRRVQEKLRQQLLRRQAEVEAELRETKAQLKTTNQQREEAGVQLYGAQQELAKLQAQLESINDRCTAATAKRTALEEAVSNLRKKHDEAQAGLQQRQQAAQEAQAEYDRLSGQVLLMERNADKLQAELKGAKRAASKAVKEQDSQEEAKQKQDLYVDRLSERVKDLEREITLAKKQKEVSGNGGRWRERSLN